MSLLLDQQFAGMIAPQLRNFVKKGHNKFNFSCPFCGDSRTIKSRARGFLLPKNERLTYYCHNCNIPGQSLATILKHLDPNMYQQYVVQKFQERQEEKKPPIDPKVTFKRPEFQRRISRELTKVSDLQSDHPVRKYLFERRIPTKLHYQLYWTAKFKAFVNSVEPGTFESIFPDEGRLVIPLIDDKDSVLGYQGRALEDGPGALKYITVLLNEDNPKIYGLDRFNRNKFGFAFEGPIDAMFIDNAVAAAGGRIDSVLNQVNITQDRMAIVYDNEPRSKFTVAKIEKAIDSGWSVVIFPDEVKETDVNNMILAGRTPAQIRKILEDNTYSSLQAKLRLAQWRKI